MRGRIPVVLALLGALSSASCDSGPEGPGTLSATVVGNASLGAVVLEFTGGTIEGFEGLGDTRAYGAALAATPDGRARHRVILVSPSGGALSFGVRVADRGAPRPSVTAVTATGRDNLPVVPSGLQIRIED